MKTKNTLTILIFSTLAAIAAIGLFVFFFSVIQNKNQNISETLAILQDKLMEKQNAEIFAEKVNEIRLLQDSINSHFVDPDKIDTFVDSLEEIGGVTGASVSVNSIEAPDATKNAISFNVLVKGTFSQVMKTITYLENIPYQVNVTKVYLNKDIKEKKETDITAVKIPDVSVWQAGITFNILSTS